ncbi:hypothetical protein BHE97_09415 [Aeromicrobium sp. PE09-221]|uniref:pyrimidine reductase family protein n=1 Tax=Aeromicrobium sp. PE09-221 TaxID=1898043 RepID=UPI000B3E63BB|nr:pyrimidine reductase family protein [Aeromicrobium sp. PE09-221]OUZ09679.1 hypothetical protein BHE97_09415 [Aeromicrobium sp. PE09-221]
MLDTVDLARRYAYPEGLDRPWVRMNFASSVDGSATTEDGVSGALGGDPDATVFALLRSLCDVILVAAGTVRAEGYEPVKPDEVHAELRAELGLDPVPPIAVVSRSLDLPEALIAPGQIVITSAASPPERRSELAEVAEVVVAGEEVVHLPTALKALDDRGLRRVLCEGGPSLHGALADEDLIDELCLTIAPVLAAGHGPRIAHSDHFAGRSLTLGHLLEAEDVLLTRWLRRRG